MTPVVSLVVVSLDGRGHLDTFLPTVAAQDFPADQLEVIVVDNGSADGTAAWLAAEHPRIRVIANESNQGFARANNQAVEAATGRYVLLVNNDMHLAPDFVSTLVTAKERHGPEVACVGARILDWDGRQVDFIEAGLTFEGKGLQVGHGEPADSPRGRGAERELLFACGGAMLVDRAVYRVAGGLDEDFFAYYEDVDFGWRLWVLGYRVMLAPGAVAHHRHNGTSSRFQSHRKEVLLERNGMCAMLKNYDDASLAAFWPAALLLAFKRLAVRSGLDRADWAFAAASVPPAPALAPPVSKIRKLARAVKRHGPKAAAKKTLGKLGEALVRRYGGPPPAAGVAIDPGAYATAVAMEDLIDHLPALWAKRRVIQDARRRSDGEIFRLFGLPFEPVEGRGRYPELEARLLATLGAPAYFERRAEARP